MKHCRWCLVVLAACGDNTRPMIVAAVDAPVPQVDAAVDAPPVDAARMVRVFGNVDFNGGLEGVTVTVIGTSQTTTTDSHGDFFFDFPEGSRLIVEATATANPELFPMIRGVVAADNLRPRVFYLMGPPDVASATSLGKTFDPTDAIVEVDYRNSQIGGYGATLTRAGGILSPTFGIVYDDNGDAVLGQQTVAGGSGSTLLLAGLTPGDVSFAAVVPAAATLPCQARDANPLPLVAGAVTWFDYECGTATD